MKLNFKKISAVASSILLTGMSLGIAAAASYPAPFVSGGAANVAIVYGTGSGVSSLDLIQAGNIQTNLQSSMGTGTGTGTTVSGDSVLIAKSSDNLNLNNNWGVFTGTIDKDELSTLLADGTYTADDNDDFDYEQTIKLGTPTFSHFRDSDYEDQAGFDEKTPTTGFKITSNTFIMNYTLDFTQDAESDIVSGDMDDIEGSDIPLMGKTYYVSDLKNGTSSTTFGKLTLLDSANVATVSEGETVTVTSGDNTYEVSISYLDNNEVKFVVNGENAPSSGKLMKGETYKLSDGSYIGARDISKIEVSGSIGSSTFSIGSGKLEITSGSEVKLNDDTINGVRGYVYRGTGSSSSEKINKIVINWISDEELFLAPGIDLTMPGFDALKFTMNDFVRSDEEKIIIQGDGSTSMELKVPIKDGDVSINFLYSNATGEFSGIGKASDERLATTNSNQLTYYEKFNGNNYDVYFVATYNISKEAQSYLLRAKVSQDTSNGRNETTIEKNVDGSWTTVCEEKIAGSTCDIGDVSLTLTEMNYTSGGHESVILTAGANVNFNTIYTNGGLRIYLPYEADDEITAAGAINITNVTGGGLAGHGSDSYYLYMDGEDKDDTIAAGTAFSFTINENSDDELQVQHINSTGAGAGSVTGGINGLEQGSSKTYETYVLDDVAPKILHLTNGDVDTAEVYYPSGDSESYAEVYLTEAGAVITAGTTGGATALGEVLVKDSEVSSVSSKNLIIVGGSCINSAAATALGVTSGTCGSAFTDATNVGSGQFLIKGVSDAFTAGKIALVVAGYESADTVNAAKYLTTQTVDTSKEYVGTSQTSATMVTTTA